MNPGNVYERRIEKDVQLKLIEKKGSSWTCLILKNDILPDLEGTICTMASWILEGRDWNKVRE